MKLTKIFIEAEPLLNSDFNSGIDIAVEMDSLWKTCEPDNCRAPEHTAASNLGNHSIRWPLPLNEKGIQTTLYLVIQKKKRAVLEEQASTLEKIVSYRKGIDKDLYKTWSEQPEDLNALTGLAGWTGVNAGQSNMIT